MIEKKIPQEIGETLRSNCEFCRLPDTKRTQKYNKLYRINDVLDIALPSRFYVAQDIVPIGFGGAQVLLIPKPTNDGHDISLAQVKDQEGLHSATDTLVQQLQDIYPGHPLFAFEHGPGQINDKQIACGGCHMDHAHGHLVILPQDKDYYPVLQSTAEAALQRYGWRDLQQRKVPSQRVFSRLASIAGSNPYLHIGIVYPNGYTAATTYVQAYEDEYVESQLMRKIISQVVFNTTDATLWHWQDAIAFGDKDALREKTFEFRLNVELASQRDITFVSTAYTAGRKLYAAFEKYHVASLDQLNALDPHIYEKEVKQANMVEGLRFGQELRRGGQAALIEPVAFHANGWSRQHFTSLWRNVLLKYANVVTLNKDWNFSVGQCHEVAAGFEKDIPLKEKDGDRSLTKREILAKISSAISYIESIGADPSSLYDAYQAIEHMKRIRTIYMGNAE